MNQFKIGGKLLIFATSLTSIALYFYSDKKNDSFLPGIMSREKIAMPSDDTQKDSKLSIYLQLVKNKLFLFKKVRDDMDSVMKETKDFYHNITMERAKILFNSLNPIGRIAAWFHSRSQNPLILVELSRSIDPVIRLMGIKSLAEMDEWQDWQFAMARQALDFKSLIAIARYSRFTDGRFFPRPPPLPRDLTEHSEDHNLSSLLQLFPVPNSDRSLGAFCDFSRFLQNSDLLYHAPSFDADDVKNDIDSMTNLKYKRLSAIAIHTSYVAKAGLEKVNEGIASDLCRTLVENKGLQILQQVSRSHDRQYDTLSRVAEIVGNVCQYPELYGQIYQSGWLSILVEWSRSQNLGLSLRAHRALANLDSPQEKSSYPPGFYLCHPLYTSTPRPLLNYSPDYYRHQAGADLYFIHGLMGDPIRTWRVADRPASVIAGETLKRARKPLPNVRQICWPKEWLGQDFPNFRIMLLGYDTYLSEWAPKFPIDPGKRTIEDRSADLLEKISLTRQCLYPGPNSAKLRRPIIFVTHSMGGLLVKRMLLDAARDETGDPRCRDLLQDTVGVVFYSTPHRGSSIAKITSRAHPIFYPSVEVKQLQLDSPDLIKMNDEFVRLAQDHSIACLSFGETENINISSYIKMMVVPKASSDMGYGEYYPLPCNHLYICKPHTRQSPQYNILYDFIQNVVPPQQPYQTDPIPNASQNSLHSLNAINPFSTLRNGEAIQRFAVYSLKCSSLSGNHTIYFPIYD